MEGNDDDDAPPSSPESVIAFQCQYCDEIFMHERLLVAHKRQAHAEAHKIDCEQREFGLLIGDPKLFVSSSEDEDDDESDVEDMDYFEVSEDDLDTSDKADPPPEPEIVQAEVQVSPAAPPSPPPQPTAEPEPPQLDLSHLTDRERRNMEKIIRYRNYWNIPKEDKEPLLIAFSDEGEIIDIHSSSSSLVLSPPSSSSGSTCGDLGDDQFTAATPSTELHSNKDRVDYFRQLVMKCLLVDVRPVMPNFNSDFWKLHDYSPKEGVEEQQVVHAGVDCENASFEIQVHCGSSASKSPERVENEIEGSSSADNSVPKVTVSNEGPVDDSELAKDQETVLANGIDSISGNMTYAAPSEEEYDALSQIEKQLQTLFETGSVNGDCERESTEARRSEEIPRNCVLDQVPVAVREETVQPSFKPPKRRRQKKRQIPRAAFAKNLNGGRKKPGNKLRVVRELVQLVKAGQYVQVPDRLRPQRPTSPPTTSELPQLEPEAPFSSEYQPTSLHPTALKVTLKRPSLDSPWHVVRPDSSPLLTQVLETSPADIDDGICCSMPILAPQIPTIPTVQPVELQPEPESQQLDSYNSSPLHTSENSFRPSPPAKRCRIQALPKKPLKEVTNTVFNCRICIHSKVAFKSAQKLADHESNVHGCSIVSDDRGNDVFTFQVPAIHKCPECDTPFRYEFVAKRHAFKCKQLKKSSKS